MRYSILTYEDGTIIPIMPFIYNGEITAGGIDEAIKKRRKERYPLPCGYHPLPANADCILLAEYADYDTFEPKPIQHVEQGLGTWRVRLKKGYARTNKVTKKPEYMPPAPYCRFHASKQIKDRLQRMTLPISKGQLAQ